MNEKGGSSFREDRPLGENARYEEHYQSADGIDIVGIACKSFWQNLYPYYGKRDLFAQVKHDRKSREARLAHLEGTPLFRNLREREFHVSVFMANPFSNFVRIRAEEENNPLCRNDILNGIDLLDLMVKDLNAAGSKESKERWKIRGSFRVSLYQENPYVSVFRAWHKEGRQGYLAVGFLFQHRRGYETPQVIVRASEGESPLVQAIDAQLAYFRGTTHPLLRWEWNRDEVGFDSNYPKACSYDVFLCHNTRDKPAVRDVAVRLREHGILPWLDEWVLGPQGAWVDALEGALKEVACVAVFAGPDGAGPWQELEIRLCLDLCARQGLRVIPVVLKGVEGEPQWTTGFLKQFQRVDFRRQSPDPVKQLVQCIRGI